MTDDARSRARRPFLTAEWRHLVMLSYEVDLDVLAPLVPAAFSTRACSERPFHGIAISTR